MRNDFLTVDECMITGQPFQRQENWLDDKGNKKSEPTVFYNNVYPA